MLLVFGYTVYDSKIFIKLLMFTSKICFTTVRIGDLVFSFNELMSTHKKKMLEKLCFFIVKIYDAVCTPNP